MKSANGLSYRSPTMSSTRTDIWLEFYACPQTFHWIITSYRSLYRNGIIICVRHNYYIVLWKAKLLWGAQKILYCPSLWPSGIGSRLGRNRLWVRFLAVSEIYPMFIEPTITWVPSGFSGYIWLDTKIVLKKSYIKNSTWFIYSEIFLHTDIMCTVGTGSNQGWLYGNDESAWFF